MFYIPEWMSFTIKEANAYFENPLYFQNRHKCTDINY